MAPSRVRFRGLSLPFWCSAFSVFSRELSRYAISGFRCKQIFSVFTFFRRTSVFDVCKLPVLHGFLSASLDYLRRCVHACLDFSPLCVFSGCANSFTLLCASTDFMCILGLPWTSDDGSVLGLHLHSPPVFFTGRTHSLCTLGDFFCLYKWIYLDMDPLCLSSVSFLDYGSVTSTVYSFTGAWGLLDHTEFRLASVL